MHLTDAGLAHLLARDVLPHAPPGASAVVRHEGTTVRVGVRLHPDGEAAAGRGEITVSLDRPVRLTRARDAVTGLVATWPHRS